VLTLTETPFAFDADQGAIAAITSAPRAAPNHNLRVIVNLQDVAEGSTTRQTPVPTDDRFKV
jgi:hypothetical protein